MGAENTVYLRMVKSYPPCLQLLYIIDDFSARDLLIYVLLLKHLTNTQEKTGGLMIFWGLFQPLTFCDSVWKQFLTNHFGLFLFCFLPFQCPKTPPNFDVNLAKILETREQEIADRRASAITLEHLVHELNEERRAKNDEILRLKVLWIKLYHQFLRLQ